MLLFQTFEALGFGRTASRRAWQSTGRYVKLVKGKIPALPEENSETIRINGMPLSMFEKDSVEKVQVPYLLTGSKGSLEQIYHPSFHDMFADDWSII